MEQQGRIAPQCQHFGTLIAAEPYRSFAQNGFAGTLPSGGIKRVFYICPKQRAARRRDHGHGCAGGPRDRSRRERLWDRAGAPLPPSMCCLR